MVKRRVYDNEKHAHFVTFSCYIRAGLVERAVEYRWGSARWYLAGKPVGLPIRWPPGLETEDECSGPECEFASRWRGILLLAHVAINIFSVTSVPLCFNSPILVRVQKHAGKENPAQPAAGTKMSMPEAVFSRRGAEAQSFYQSGRNSGESGEATASAPETDSLRGTFRTAEFAEHAEF